MTNFRSVLENNILDFWATHMVDRENGGFYGRIDGHGQLHEKANKGVVLHARILWTFAAAYRQLGNPEYKGMADRAFHYLVDHFIDNKYGGVYWELDHTGRPVNTKKQTYAQGFALYAFAEYYRATGCPRALTLAMEFFHTIERHADHTFGGYFEAFTADWNPIDDMRLSTKDANERKTMNTHLHILEPYTNLLRIWNNPQLKTAQRNLIAIFTDRILDRNTGHLQLFFDETWRIKSTLISYGHDIEAAWLLLEAAEVLRDPGLLNKLVPIAIRIADAAAKGIQPDGSLAYERDGHHLDLDRHWWVQAEAVVGFMYAFKYTDNTSYRDIAKKIWAYIQDQLLDHDHGEWYWSRTADGSINRDDDKAGFWKCPYHNSRCCLTLMALIGD